MDLMFEGEKKACYISHTKVQLEKSGKEYEFITVYVLNSKLYTTNISKLN